MSIVLSLFPQLPFLCGLPFLERRAPQTAHLIAGKSGKHLFLTDNDDGKPPLLLRMVNDSDDLKFMLVIVHLCHLSFFGQTNLYNYHVVISSFVDYVGQDYVYLNVVWHMQMQIMTVSLFGLKLLWTQYLCFYFSAYHGYFIQTQSGCRPLYNLMFNFTFLKIW